jgi:hypothetical protein
VHHGFGDGGGAVAILGKEPGVGRFFVDNFDAKAVVGSEA